MERKSYGNSNHYYDSSEDSYEDDEEIRKHNWGLIGSDLFDDINNIIDNYRKIEPRLNFISTKEILGKENPKKVRIVDQTYRYYPYELRDDQYIRECILEIEELLNNYYEKYKPTNEFLDAYESYFNKIKKEKTQDDIEKNMTKMYYYLLFQEYDEYNDTYYHDFMDRNSMYKRISCYLKKWGYE